MSRELDHKLKTKVVKKRKMKKGIRLIGTVVIAMALMIAFSGVASAGYSVQPPSETENIKITTTISSNRMVVESERLG
jgi:hypothetical protein